VDYIKLLISLGLFLDIVGILLLAFFSVPTTTLSPDGTDTLVMKSGEEETAKNIKKYRRNRTLTTVAYFLIIIGFILQLVANWVTESTC